MARTIFRCDFLRDRRLVLAGTAEFLESQGDGLNILLPGITHQPDQSAGIDSAGF